ncbi:MAG: hypothetical protein FWH00_03460 [Oscillospiraceae bacterium]|nr:hypothetical protein [Oscillospiraceae bacterium]
MNPCEMNAAMALITNHLYANMSREDFINLGVFLSMVSKDMLSMAALEELLRWEKHEEEEHHHHKE